MIYNLPRVHNPYVKGELTQDERVNCVESIVEFAVNNQDLIGQIYASNLEDWSGEVRESNAWADTFRDLQKCSEVGSNNLVGYDDLQDGISRDVVSGSYNGIVARVARLCFVEM